MYIQKLVMSIIHASLNRDNQGEYYIYYCSKCYNELGFCNYYCNKCGNFCYPCEKCENEQTFIQMDLIAYKTTSIRINKMYDANDDANDDLSRITEFVCQCPKCKIVKKPYNCNCVGSCSCYYALDNNFDPNDKSRFENVKIYEKVLNKIKY